MALGAITVKGQPELEKVLNALVKEINRLKTPTIVAGRGISILQQGDVYVVSALRENDYTFCGLHPRVLKDGVSPSVGLTAGYVTFPRKGTTSISVPPYIGANAGVGIAINAADPPSITLAGGTYYTRLKMEAEHTAKVDFILTSETPATDADYLIINKFTLTVVSGGYLAISDVEIYQSEPMAAGYTTDSAKWFGVTNTSDPEDPGVYKVQVRGGVIYAPDLYGASDVPPTIVALLQNYEVDAIVNVPVADGQSVYLEIPVYTTKSYETTVDEAETTPAVDVGDHITAHITHKNVIYSFDPVTVVTASAHAILSPPVNTTTKCYILLADITIDGDGAMTIEQRHDGAITVPAVSLPYIPSLNTSSDLVIATVDICDGGSVISKDFIVTP